MVLEGRQQMRDSPRIKRSRYFLLLINLRLLHFLFSQSVISTLFLLVSRTKCPLFEISRIISLLLTDAHCLADAICNTIKWLKDYKRRLFFLNCLGKINWIIEWWVWSIALPVIVIRPLVVYSYHIVMFKTWQVQIYWWKQFYRRFRNWF